MAKEGVSAAVAVKLFKSWVKETDITAVVAASLQRSSMDDRLMGLYLPISSVEGEARGWRD